MWKTLIVWEVGLMAVTVQGHGPCKVLHGLMLDFNLDEYAGVWYPLMGWSNVHAGDIKGKCSKETISNNNGNITITEESISDKIGAQSSSHHAWQDEPNEGKITMWMFHAIKVPFWIVDTDYKHWAVVYSCSGDENEYLKTLLVLGRGRDFSKMWQNPQVKKNIRRSLRRSNLLRLRDLTSINQTDCTN
ncbi:apolipoprotein D-like [Macrosteles quadrilineatus]|uniref:apolipoprotein D-like n=1 Tax=Macrosteles quadrilineatus TaxID=74068 RepID=UPI0023E0E87F|nr:apolipoprotein D-like [Macrosteles quadrilineatus]